MTLKPYTFACADCRDIKVRYLALPPLRPGNNHLNHSRPDHRQWCPCCKKISQHNEVIEQAEEISNGR